MIIRTEYWLTPEIRDLLTKYSANYGRIILFDKDRNIITELMEPNPWFSKAKDYHFNLENEDPDMLL